MMKLTRVITSLILTGSVLFSGEEWIQVVYAKNAKAVSADFLERVKKSGYPYRLIDKNGTLKIWIGSFDSYHEAQAALPLIRCRIASDAFIVQNHKGVSVEAVPKSLQTVASKKKPESVKAEAEKVQVEDKEPKEPEIAQPCTCICDKQALRKAQMQSAMDFYRNSSDYRFTGEN